MEKIITNHAGSKFLVLDSGRYRLDESRILTCTTIAPLDLMCWAIKNNYTIRGVMRKPVTIGA